MKFDVKTEAGVEALNKYLTDFSYVNGFTPSNDDVACFNALSSAPDATKFVNAARWYRHIASFNATERTAWGGDAAVVSAAASKTTTAAAAPSGGDDDFDPFAEEEEDPEWEAEKERRAKEANDRKAASGKKVIGKSLVTLDVKPYDDETDMVELERLVREITKEGLEWKKGELVEIAYGLKKLRINAVIVDDLVSVDDIEEQIMLNEELVQSVDVHNFQKL
eukprot:TRINITY_DN198_c1_g3_i1.p1 TRINITY_DN198_c1_g3~~TRINITY_DN198_c1_g3_i1.p1  ORF type:complete len:222 (-),score=139.20 TRINITY_DN198_c1_g3_i1:89-754(-)